MSFCRLEDTSNAAVAAFSFGLQREEERGKSSMEREGDVDQERAIERE